MLDRQTLASALRHEGRLTRRLFLGYAAALSALPTWQSRSTAADRPVSFPTDPFKLGVASGDPTPSGVVLWTKLAPKPEDADGGMKPEAVNVTWEIAEDEAMKNVVAKGTTPATPELGHSVHVEAEGLKPDRWHWYRFRAGDAVSPIGRTRTMPAADATPEKLRFAFVSCQNFEQGLFTGYAQMAKDNLDLVVHLGDYIYEYPGKDKLVRKHSGPRDRKIHTLADYRGRHAQYRADPLLHGMHAVCPWLVTWDDHEFDNNYANDIEEAPYVKGGKKMDVADFLARRAAAYQAYYEMMPLRSRSLPKGPNMTIYRESSFGRLADFFVLDTRQYRTDQPNGDGIKPLNAEAMKATNTLLGKAQREWLEDSLTKSQARWNVLAQQVMMALVEIQTSKGSGFSMDQWPGAAHERIELVKFLADRKISDPVVLTGDIHSNWVNNLREDDRKAETPVVATEFVGTSISSGGNPKPFDPSKLAAANPCVQFHNRERGYVRCEVTPKTWTSDYVAIEDVTKENGDIVTRASFVVETGVPGAKKA